MCGWRETDGAYCLGRVEGRTGGWRWLHRRRTVGEERLPVLPAGSSLSCTHTLACSLGLSTLHSHTGMEGAGALGTHL